MSQKKVDAYKDYKKNRTQILKKEKRMKKLEYGAVGAVLALIVFWAGFSVYRNIDNNIKAAEAEAAAVLTEVDYNSYMGYVSGLSTSYTE
ncbi:MAG: hypothetical protein Q4B15_04130 [Lachnospiraceae bacterium]|nr:hypothetical protein [Lachnospiraceae bacterium]